MHCVKVIGSEGRSICYIFWFIFKDFFSFPAEIKNDLATKNIPQADWEETLTLSWLSQCKLRSQEKKKKYCTELSQYTLIV